MASTINTKYSMYEKMLRQADGKRDAGRKKAAGDAKKVPAGFGDDCDVQFSDAALAAMEAQRKQRAEREAKGSDGPVTEDKLSDKAKDFLANLREKYGDYDFFAVGSIDDPRIMSLRGTKAYSVFLTNDEIEKMANDEKYAEEVMQKVESAVEMTKRIQEKGELGEGVRFRRIAIAFDSDGNMKLFAELEKMSERQRERMEKAKEKRAEEKKEAERKRDKDDGKDKPGATRVRVEATSEEELLEKILGIDWDDPHGTKEKGGKGK